MPTRCPSGRTASPIPSTISLAKTIGKETKGHQYNGYYRELINKRRFSHQQLETISDVGSDAASDVVTDDEDDSLAFDTLFPYSY